MLLIATQDNNFCWADSGNKRWLSPAKCKWVRWLINIKNLPLVSIDRKNSFLSSWINFKLFDHLWIILILSTLSMIDSTNNKNSVSKHAAAVILSFLVEKRTCMPCIAIYIVEVNSIACIIIHTLQRFPDSLHHNTTTHNNNFFK